MIKNIVTILLLICFVFQADAAKKYLGKNPVLKNGKPLTSKRDYALASTVAASKGYKIAEGANSFIVIDRSAFITKKK